ncbi:Asparaginase/glutaminase, partial [Ilyonectria sp. MPI-CAGE-AT-0026]
SLPNVLFILVGGTIAGVGRSATEYDSGVLNVKELIKTAPELPRICNVYTKQLANVDSVNQNSSINIDLSLTISEEFATGGINGAVFMMGTATIDQTALFLDLTINSTNPVVGTGSIRPSTDVSADGPGNLMSAAIVASSTKARNRGVMVVFNNKIFSAHLFTKIDANSLDAFHSESSLGTVYKHVAQFFFNPARPSPHHYFKIDRNTSIPQAQILYGHQEISPEFISNVIQSGIKILILASMGGHWTTDGVESMASLTSKIFIFISGLEMSGFVGGNHGFLGSGYLNPAQMRIMAQLVVATGQD